MSKLIARFALFKETAEMALDTLRVNKMRSALTVLGIVIGITSIVGMTSLIRGFDQSLQNTIRMLGPKTIFVAKFSALSLSAGASFMEMMRRPPSRGVHTTTTNRPRSRPAVMKRSSP